MNEIINNSWLQAGFLGILLAILIFVAYQYYKHLNRDIIALSKEVSELKTMVYDEIKTLIVDTTVALKENSEIMKQVLKKLEDI